MNQHTLRLHSLAVALAAVALTLAGVQTSSAVDSSGDAQPLQAGLDSPLPSTVAASSSTAWMGALASLEGSNAASSQLGALGTGLLAGAGTADASPILGTDPDLGPIAAPITRFRDGGHAYYLYGQGLHSCTYLGKCLDAFAPIGEPLYAMADGVVKIPPYAAHSYGNYLIIKFRDGSKAIYAHMHDISIKPGPVKAGTRIGSVGCSGTSGESNRCRASEQHLHFEWSGLNWSPGEYGELPPYFNKWRGEPRRCYKGCGPNS